MPPQTQTASPSPPLTPDQFMASRLTPDDFMRSANKPEDQRSLLGRMLSPENIARSSVVPPGTPWYSPDRVATAAVRATTAPINLLRGPTTPEEAQTMKGYGAYGYAPLVGNRILQMMKGVAGKIGDPEALPKTVEIPPRAPGQSAIDPLYDIVMGGELGMGAGDILEGAGAAGSGLRSGVRALGRTMEANAPKVAELAAHPVATTVRPIVRGGIRQTGRILQRVAGPEAEPPAAAPPAAPAPQPAPGQPAAPTQSFSPQPLSTEPAPAPTVWPPERPSAIQPRNFESPADRMETRSLQEQMQEDLEQHGRQAYSQEKRDWFARNQPGTAKGDLQTQSRQSLLEDMGHTEGPDIYGGSQSETPLNLQARMQAKYGKHYDIPSRDAEYWLFPDGTSSGGGEGVSHLEAVMNTVPQGLSGDPFRVFHQDTGAARVITDARQGVLVESFGPLNDAQVTKLAAAGKGKTFTWDLKGEVGRPRVSGTGNFRSFSNAVRQYYGEAPSAPVEPADEDLVPSLLESIKRAQAARGVQPPQ